MGFEEWLVDNGYITKISQFDELSSVEADNLYVMWKEEQMKNYNMNDALTESMRLINKHNQRYKQLVESINSAKLSNDDAKLILEIVIDALSEVGNGISDDKLHEEKNHLIALRYKWFNQIIKDTK